MPNKITIVSEGRTHEGDPGGCKNLLEYLITQTPFSLAAPCGSTSRCGKCRVRFAENPPAPSPEEEKLLPRGELDRGVRLACVARKPESVSGLTVILNEELPVETVKSALLSGFAGAQPAGRKEYIRVPEPRAEKGAQASDEERLAAAASPGETLRIPLEVLKALPDALRAEAGEVTLCRFGDTVLSVEAGDTRDRFYGVAVDMGTTTVAAYLMDLRTGENIAAVSALNAQKTFGADCISRIGYTMNSADGLEFLREKIITQINSMTQGAAGKAGIRGEDVYLVSLAGNTTMLHLVLGIPPRNIAAAPFIPVTSGAGVFLARELGLSAAPGGLALILPGISAYVGADITAAILACDMDQDDAVNLLIDIGTNGEIVLGNRVNLSACSTAAGPAFEGAHILCGTGGVPGAIDSVKARDGGELIWTTLGEEAPRGICGSGIIDLLAFLLRSGIVDETGRMLGEEEIPPNSPASAYRGRLIKTGGETSFLLVPEEESGTGSAIVFTGKDVREIQLAKAAIAAGLRTLMSRRGISARDIKRLYLAGGFGSHIHGESAAAIGLFSLELAGKIRVVGNAAGKGAALYLVSGGAASRCQAIHRLAEYVELSSSPEFMDAYVEEMSFPVLT